MGRGRRLQGPASSWRRAGDEQGLGHAGVGAGPHRTTQAKVGTEEIGEAPEENGQGGDGGDRGSAGDDWGGADKP
jgi:hypothetical protein